MIAVLYEKTQNFLMNDFHVYDIQIFFPFLRCIVIIYYIPLIAIHAQNVLGVSD